MTETGESAQEKIRRLELPRRSKPLRKEYVSFVELLSGLLKQAGFYTADKPLTEYNRYLFFVKQDDKSDSICDNVKGEGRDAPADGIRSNSGNCGGHGQEGCLIVINADGDCAEAKELAGLSENLKRDFAGGENGSELQIMHLIVTDRKEDAESLQDMGLAFWIIDMSSGRIMIYENQPDDFFGIRRPVESALYAPRGEYKARRGGGLKRIFRALPPATISLIIVNVLAFVICEISGSTDDAGFMLEAGALSANAVFSQHEYYRLFTSMFLHFGFLHLANNMFILYIIGSPVERWFGVIRYLILYFASGLAGGTVSIVFHAATKDPVISAGASGAIYGLFGALLMVLLIRRKETGEYGAGRLIFVLALLIAGSIQQDIDFTAHIGGLVAGAVISAGFILTGRIRFGGRRDISN